MKIKAMVDGIEREVELVGAQINQAYEKTQEEIDTDDARFYIEDNWDTFDGVDEIVYQKMIDNVRDIAKNFRHALENSDDSWSYYMRDAFQWYLDTMNLAKA